MERRTERQKIKYLLRRNEMDEDTEVRINSLNGRGVLDVRKGLSGLARKLEKERKQLEDRLKVLETEKQALIEKIEDSQQELYDRTEEYRLELKEFKEQQEKVKKRYEVQIESLEDEKNDLKIEMVDKEAELKSGYEKKINELGVEVVALKGELRELQIREGEEQSRRGMEAKENAGVISGMEEQLRVKEEERKKQLYDYERELKDLEEVSMRERDILKEKMHSRDMEIQNFKIEMARLKAQINSERRQREGETEKIKHETMSQALKELEKRLSEERQEWREKLNEDNF